MPGMLERQVTISVVSHAQNALASAFLADVERCCAGGVSLIVTENVPDAAPLAMDAVQSAPVERISNARIKGFGANHNAAFARCRTPFFCVANPDIRLVKDPFPALLESLRRDAAGVAGPLVRGPAGSIEDSARRYPTLKSLARKAFARSMILDYPSDRGPIEVDWVAGMFMLFKAEAYRAVGGFDEAYFLYYEDVDICRRLRRRGARAIYDPRVEVIHHARRASRRNPRHARHHLSSMLRFLLSP
jgi:GT2 family glycosyltransferase